MKLSDIRHLTPLAKDLRKNSTITEAALWRILRANRFSGARFKRQQPIGNYIVDFVSLERKLIIELDGGQHALVESKDRQRDAWLRR
jgi:very-short-patch-repair endonuclease